MVRPHQLRQINLQAAEESGENANQHRSQQHVALGILYFLGEDGDTVKSDKHQSRKGGSGRQSTQIEGCGIVDRAAEKRVREGFVENDVANSVNQKSGGDQQHESQQDFIGACVELDSLNRHQRDERDDHERKAARTESAEPCDEWPARRRANFEWVEKDIPETSPSPE